MNNFRFYQLTLSNDLDWCIGISENLSEWGDFFARLLQLKRCSSEGSPRIYVLPSMDTEQEMTHVRNIFTHEHEYLTFPNHRMHFYYQPHTKVWVCFFSRKKENYDIFDTMTVLFCMYYHVIEAGGLLLHGALLFHPEYQGAAILAPGDTGKSTCARRIVPPWSALCDDTFLAIKDLANTYSAHPVPTWSEFCSEESCYKTWNIEHHVPLQSLFFLQQGEKDAIVPLRISDAALQLYRSNYQVFSVYLRKFTRFEQFPLNTKIFSNACNMAKKYRVFELRATLDGQFWEVMEQILITDQTFIYLSSEG